MIIGAKQVAAPSSRCYYYGCISELFTALIIVDSYCTILPSRCFYLFVHHGLSVFSSEQHYRCHHRHRHYRHCHYRHCHHHHHHRIFFIIIVIIIVVVERFCNDLKNGLNVSKMFRKRKHCAFLLLLLLLLPTRIDYQLV